MVESLNRPVRLPPCISKRVVAYLGNQSLLTSAATQADKEVRSRRCGFGDLKCQGTQRSFRSVTVFLYRYGGLLARTYFRDWDRNLGPGPRARMPRHGCRAGLETIQISLSLWNTKTRKTRFASYLGRNERPVSKTSC